MALFHYTGTESAFKIIESGVLHATHWKYLNDGSEMEAIKPQLVEIFSQEFEQVGLELISAGLMSRKIIEHHGMRVFIEEAARLVDIAYRVTYKVSPVFIASLCRHDKGSDQERDGLLSQWRGYGAGGGCALEFDESVLETMLAKEADRYACVHITLQDVDYFNHERALRGIAIEGLAQAVLKKLAKQDMKKNTKIIDDGMKALQTAIFRVAPMLKHRAFSEENEARIVIPCMTPEAAKEYPQRKLKTVHFRFRDGLPVPYVKIFDGKKPLPIKRIIVGPQRREADVAHTIRLALKARKMDATVDVSSIPLVF
ncbi:MAG: DUF2971 domain-containing protein [Bosea sp. (in: a-proteobacteria)]|uniref:DUF2971 domain-containing protein n=1 Tax=Bosea sp. (in: a-proteobacteria) TaxID=1871050 RepID=UPI0027354FDA|nr:DUF2971 domain-containing protein [Bosea sp. (in: a-proteobacteria)]MDP3602219.1 DUF2971 domain-containing protein [Bosea sp. (in: a-proteobacteria)]